MADYLPSEESERSPYEKDLIKEDDKRMICRKAVQDSCFAFAILLGSAYIVYQGVIPVYKKCPFSLFMSGCASLGYICFMVLRALSALCISMFFSRRPRTHYMACTSIFLVIEMAFVLPINVYSMLSLMSEELKTCRESPQREIRHWWIWCAVVSGIIGSIYSLVLVCHCCGVFWLCCCAGCTKGQGTQQVIDRSSFVPYVRDLIECCFGKRVGRRRPLNLGESEEDTDGRDRV